MYENIDIQVYIFRYIHIRTYVDIFRLTKGLTVNIKYLYVFYICFTFTCLEVLGWVMFVVKVKHTCHILIFLMSYSLVCLCHKCYYVKVTELLCNRRDSRYYKN